MRKQLSILVILSVCALLLLSGCAVQKRDGVELTSAGSDSGSADAAIKIGFMGPLTGDAAAYGESVKAAVEYAKQELGSNIEIVYEDSKCEGKEATTVINKLISVDGVQAIIGELCSGATLAAAPIAEEHKVVMISAASTSPKLSDHADYVFRSVPSDALQGDFGAKLVAEKGKTKLAVLYGNEDYGLGFKEVLDKAFPEAGGEVVAAEAFERGSTDMRTQLTKIKEAGPDAMYIISNSPDSAVAALKQAKELGLDVLVVGSEGLKSDDLLEAAGASAEGLVVTSVSTGSNDFKEKYKESTEGEPGPFAAQGVDAFHALHLAIEGGATSGEAISAALKDLTFDGASGSIDFDDKGDVSGNYEVYVVKDGAFVTE